MRKIVLDIETTGLRWEDGHEIVEIGCVELFDGIPTDHTWHSYLNANRQMDDEVIKIHGITNEFLLGKPRFHEVVDDLLIFLGSDPIIAHNATFDISFINYWLNKLGLPNLANQIIDTLVMARKLQSRNNSLDALCTRYGVNLKDRTTHGALKDAILLGKVYFYLCNDFNDQIYTLDSFNTSFQPETTTIKFINREKFYHLKPEDELLHTNFLKTHKLNDF